MRRLRPAFTIIEILISVIIITLAIVPVLKTHTSSHEQIVYISERNKRSLEDSLFLGNNILSYHKDNKSAYDLVGRFFKIRDFESREILRKINRDIFIPVEMNVLSLQEQGGPSTTVNTIMLKDKHSSTYYDFKLEGL